MIPLARILAPALLFLWFQGRVDIARPAELTLFTDAPPAAPLVITPLDVRDQLLVSVANSVASDPPTEYLTGWQFRLVIQPDAGAVGSLHFGTGTKPPNYVLDSVVHLGPSSATVNEVFSALDSQFSSPLSGVPVPTAPGANLISISFVPDANARGTFGVYAKDGQDSFWLDAANNPNNHARPFVNTPVGGGLVRIADILVTSVADYSRNGTVDAADYVLWRDTLGMTGAGLAADGNGDGMVDAGDYGVWRTNFGTASPAIGAGVSAASGAVSTHFVGAPPPRLGGPTAAVPEPATFLLLAIATQLLTFVRLRRRSMR